MNTTDLDGISLEQALIDFEVANARVMDLTSRLTSMSRELISARSELERIKVEQATQRGVPMVSPALVAEHAELKERFERVRSSRAVQIAAIFSGKLRRFL
ncbi:MAG: hypothetical protein ACN6RJ_12140 [Stenotrophomonas sp.]|uniref:hypothetical protein n=1 Tax=Stenotrophomonas sp. TaxID=69392 RepID=UPI0028B0327D|nr:hypothetical protein [Stenotrophomonas sp.]